MNKNKLSLFPGALAMLAVASHVNAQQAPRCSDLVDDTQRLACYDAAFGKPSRPAAAPMAPASAAASRSMPAAGSAAVPAVAPAATLPVTPQATAKPAAPAPETGTFTVASLGHKLDGRFVITLSNGQVWTQVEKDSRVEFATGDQITLKRAALGSFMLVTRAGLPTRVTFEK